MDISVERIRQLLDYNPETGLFTWLHREIRPDYKTADKSFNVRFAGKQAAVRISGKRYAYLNIFCKNYLAHRIAWAHFYGVFPAGNIDHINGSPSDNRISNLRLATQSQNLMNAAVRSDNTSGHKGVSFHKQTGKWRAYIMVDRKVTSLGLHHSPKDALASRLKAEKELFGDFSVLHR